MTTDAVTGADAAPGADVAPVVAVVVTCNPGPWFEETLTALGAQDYPNLAVLIIDAASTEDPLPRIAEALPSAYVRRLARNPGYAAATNRALRIVQGASHLVLCHDDIAPAPDAIRLMVEESHRTNAGIVTPKMVNWDDPRELLALGGTVDSTGAFIPLVEPGDRDQGQFNSGEVFATTGGCMLVRSDLFTALDGFDPAMAFWGEDIDLSWRVQVVGARIVTAPRAKVRHLGATLRKLRDTGMANEFDGDEGDGDRTRAAREFLFLRRHRLRTVLKVRRRRGLIVALMQLMVLSLAEIAYFIVTARAHQAVAVASAWTWNLGRWRELMKLRRALQRHREVSDRDIDAQLGSTRTRLGGLLRQEWEARRDRLRIENPGRELAGALRNLPVAVWLSILAIWIVGSRSLVAGGLPVIGQFAPLPEDPMESFYEFFGSWPADGFGVATTSSLAHLFVAVGGLVAMGAMGVLHKVIVLGALPLGVWGMSRLARALQSQRARLMAIVAYVAIPLPYDSLSLGRWDGLLTYALAPWLLASLLRVHGAAPYLDTRRTLYPSLRWRWWRNTAEEEDLEALVVSERARPEARVAAAEAALQRNEKTSLASRKRTVRRDRIWFLVVRRVLPLALLLTAIGGFAPQFMVAAVLVSVAFAFGSIVTQEPGSSKLVTIGVIALASAIALILLLPGIVGSDAGWSAFYRANSSVQDRERFGDLFRFAAGGFTPALATFGLLIAAIPGLLFGREWRFHLSVRLWFVSLFSVFVAWLGARGWLGAVDLDPHMFLAPAAAALALNAGVGAAAVQQDLSTYRFGWRQLLPFVALAGVAVSVVPIALRAGNGAWDLPSVTNTELLSYIPEQQANGSFRVLWLGDSNLMPGGARRISDDLSAAIAVDSATPNGPVPPPDGGVAMDRVARDVTEARNDDTVQLGKLLAPYSVRYIVIPSRTGSIHSSGLDAPAPADLTGSFSKQLDLRTIQSDEAMQIYENVAWLPIRSQLAPADVLASHGGGADASQSANLSGSTPVLNNNGAHRRWIGSVGPDEVFVGEAQSSNWRMTVDGVAAARQTGFEWANTFSVPSPGAAHLHYDAPTRVTVVQLLDAIGLVLLVLLVVRFRNRPGPYV